jgi:hypothetical protein
VNEGGGDVCFDDGVASWTVIAATVVCETVFVLNSSSGWIPLSSSRACWHVTLPVRAWSVSLWF